MRAGSLIRWSLALTAVTAFGEADKRFEDPPFGCFVQQTHVIDARQRDEIGTRLGVPLKKLTNIDMKVQGAFVKVNLLETRTKADAADLHGKLLTLRGHPAFCLREGRTVVEFAKTSRSVALKAAWELGFTKKPEEVRYRVVANVATIEKADYKAFNALFNALSLADPKAPGRKEAARIEELSEGFSFGRSLTLRSAGNGARYSFGPAPAGEEKLEADTMAYVFDQPLKHLGIPYVTLTAEVACDGSGLTPTTRRADKALLAATPFWPVDDPEIKKRAAKLTKGCRTDEPKVQALLEWLAPGRNIKVAGPSGSRWGVKRVLEQEFGHCWDASDVFVTLARAAGIPCRQVGGWLFGASGHIWAEVLIEGKGWQQVDPSGAGKLACGIYHIPYFTSETGKMPILYTAMPRIEVMDAGGSGE